MNNVEGGRMAEEKKALVNAGGVNIDLSGLI